MLKTVHSYPSLQHPPPREVAQAIWLVVHPDGISLTTAEVVGRAVLTQLLLDAHAYPKLQHPPPKLAAQRKALVAVQERGQQLATTVAVDEMVVVDGQA